MKSKSLKVIISCPTFFIGGTSSHALKLSSALRRRGHWTSALVADPFGQLHDDFREQFDQVVVVRRGAEARASYLRRLIGTMLGLNADVLINNMLPFVQAALPWMPPTQARFSVLHSIVPEEVQSGTANHGFVDRIIAVSQNVAEVAANRVPASKLTVIPVGVEPNAYLREKSGASGRLRLVYAGRLSCRAKNLRVLEEVLKELFNRGVEFEFTAIGDGDYRSEMEKRLAGLAFAKQVHFEGVLSPGKMVSRLSEFHAFIMTSTYEGTPHALLEAMAAGVVPVCSCIPGATDQLIEHKKTGYLCRTHEVDDYVSAIGQLAQDPAAWGQMSQNAQDFVRGKFSMDVVVDQYLELIARSRSAVGKEKMQSSSPKLTIAPELVPMCPTLLRQVRRLGGDVYRRWFHGVRPVDLSGME